MDKKKVIELIGNVEKYLLAYEKSGKNADIAMAFQQLHEAEDELSKSDWISVEDELPPYDEEVLVCSKILPNITWVDSRDPNMLILNGFIQEELFGNTITHWCKIDKLEV